jgi:ankyrin repeat protein
MRKILIYALIIFLAVLSACASVSIKDTYQKDPAEKEFERGILLMVKQKQDLNATDVSKSPPLIQAAAKGYVDSVRFLLERGANSNIKDEVTKTSALHQAICSPTAPRPNPAEEQIIKLLIENKANVDSNDNYGNTPLHQALNFNRLEAVQVLISNKANPDVANSAGVTPLHLAVSKGSVEAVEILIKAGADVNLKTGGQMTPLDIARAEVKKRTTHWGPQKNTTAAAQLESYSKIAELLEKAGAKATREQEKETAPLFKPGEVKTRPK